MRFLRTCAPLFALAIVSPAAGRCEDLYVTENGVGVGETALDVRTVADACQ